MGDWEAPITVQDMYGDWDDDVVTAALGRSLSPRSTSDLVDLVGEYGAGPDTMVLDIGGREGAHALLMAERFGCRVLAVDAVQANLDRGQPRVDAHAHGDLVELRLGTIEAIPAADESFQVVFCRDMIGHVADLGAALAECHRVLAPGGHMVVFHVFATPELYPEEARRLALDGAGVLERMHVHDFESHVAASGLSVERVEITGSEFIEASQEQGTAPNHLLEISRMRRAKEALVAEIGEVPYRAFYASALYSIYRAIGKLESRVYVLAK